ncbi:MAG: hypothetical protein O3C57_08095, partial [Verrucomicrobia bacterium]|nr:hypothetical protein [Verrucomicrobiota bacterium]
MKKFSIFNFQFSLILHGFLFLTMSILVVRGFLAAFAPPPYTPPFESSSNYQLDAMMNAMSAGAVRTQLDDIASLGNRFIGSPGFYDCEALIRRLYGDAGLELHEHSIRTTAPQTEFSEA